MDLSAISSPASLALLVDGENLSKDLAPDVLRAISRFGSPQVRRVYGNLNAVTGWEDHGFRLCPTRPGKNSADMLLCVEAMALALRDGFDTLVIASSDRDFSYLAEQLREMGKGVIGVVEAKAPAAFRMACSSFTVLEPAPSLGSASAAPVVSSKTGLLALVRKAVAEAGHAGLPIGSLNPTLHRAGVKISDTSEKTWRNWLSARPAIFVCDPKGPNARVRLKACPPHTP